LRRRHVARQPFDLSAHPLIAAGPLKLVLQVHGFVDRRGECAFIDVARFACEHMLARRLEPFF
jgi:hypothetical protein